MSLPNAPKSELDTEHTAHIITELLEKLTAEGHNVPDHLIQQLLTVSVKLFVNKIENEERIAPFLDQSITATDVVMTVSEMLDHVNLELFELGMWRSSRKPY